MDQHTRCALLCVFLLTSGEAFKVSAPQDQVLAVYGEPAVLGCSYPTSPTVKLESLVITWQRSTDSAVVHSFYYSKDQLDKQNKTYNGRTQLFLDELLKGNASLRLDKVRPMDEGTYQCSVTSSDGTGKTEVRVKFAAFYSEPQLTIQVHHTNVTFRYESKGYPAPEVQWVDLTGKNLSYSTYVNESSGGTKLFSFQTNLMLEAQQKVSYNFTLKNSLLGQVIKMPVVFSNNYDNTDSCNDHDSRRIHIILGSIIFFICSALIIFLIIWKKKKN